VPSTSSDLRVLYVTSRWDAPYRYRAAQACGQLRAEGAVANVLHIDDPQLSDAIGRYGVVVLFRLPWSGRVDAIVTRAREAGVPVAFDVDDLVFDPVLLEAMPFRERFTVEAWHALYGQQALDLRRTVEVCDLFIGSTPALAEHAARLGKRAAVHPNVVPSAYLSRGALLAPLGAALRPHPTLGYFAGSNTHDEDLASITPALLRVFEAVPTARLLVGGYVELGVPLARQGHRVLRLPYMHWQDYACAFAACHANLAPQAVRNPFTDAKSALKFFEAGAFHTPTVATPVREMARAIEHGVSGFLASTEDEWVQTMITALDAETSARMGAQARRATETHHSEQAVRGRLRALLEAVAVPAPGKRPRATSLWQPEDPNVPSLLARARRPGEVVLDLGRLVTAARTEPAAPLDLDALDRWIVAVREHAALRDQAAAAGAIFAVVDDRHPLTPNALLGPRGALPGEVESLGADPYWMTGEFQADPSKIRYLVVRMRACAQGVTGRGQCFWRHRTRPFDEAQSTSFPVALDGGDHTTVVDLWQPALRKSWQRTGEVHQLRFDPLGQAGSVRLSFLALLPDGYAEPWTTTLADLAGLELKGAPDAGARTTLRSATADLREEETLNVDTTYALPALRALLAAALADTEVDVRDVATRPSGATAVLARTRTRRPGVDVVIPVHGALAEALRAARSVVRYRPEGTRLVLIDDASPDPDVAPELRRFAASHPGVVFLQNDVNLGFVRTCNLGMAHAGHRDVLLLNSDTEVFAGFLEGLRRAAYSRAGVGMASPLSNNATICSVPEFCRPNGVPEGHTRESFAELVRRTSLRRYPELVTPHGFCLYLRRDCLEAIGPFDTKKFGRGFGEENELGERAKKSGWAPVLADEVYVWHDGSASFKEDAHALTEHNAKVLEAAHPGYHAAVARFIADNPLAPVHENLKWHLERRSLHREPAPLLLLHASPFAEEPGGVEHCVRDLVRALALPRVLLAYPAGSGVEITEVLRGDLVRARPHGFPLASPVPRFCHEHPGAIEALAEAMELFRVGAVHVHHLMYWPLSVGRMLRERGVPYLVTVHDFYTACPSFNLLRVDETRLCCPGSCGDAERTRACMRALFHTLAEPLDPDPVAFVERHRTHMRELLDGAARVQFPSESARSLTARILGLDPAAFAVVPHGYDVRPPARRPRPTAARLRVALLGNVAYASKGAAAILETVRRTRHLDLEWHVFGRTDRFGFDRHLDEISGVRIIRHGGYDRATIVDELVTARIDIGLLLPPWPETFSYTLSELLSAGVVVIARRIGALADRLEAGSPGILVDDAADAARVLERLVRDPAELARHLEAAARFVHPPSAPWAAAHAALYEGLLRDAPTFARAAMTDAELTRLNEVRRPPRAPVSRSAVVVTQPDPRFAGAWWFPFAERLKRYAPETVRQTVRRRLARDGAATVHRYRLPGPLARIGAGLSLEKSYFGTSRLTVHDDDPYLELETRPFAPDTVDMLRFNLWCSTHGAAYAQLYWRHAGDAHYTEEQSVQIPLQGASGAWQEYVVLLRETRAAPRWFDGGPIVSMRFDPINMPGIVCLGELSLCRAPRP
jgi:GT2 family glycosyltransferase/glycosyltransferase involved in cell wall biosynthesis